MCTEHHNESQYEAAARLIIDCEHLLITAGAGMSVDSGLPDFRGKEGFYRAYPIFKKSGLNFYDIANPSFLSKNPRDFWWFYGHRFQIYKDAIPHNGFKILKQWFEEKDSYIFTSNVDGQFQKAGFSDFRIVECHGSINYLQCGTNCDKSIEKISALPFTPNRKKLEISGDLPKCRACGGNRRPNIFMFNDYDWAYERTERQKSGFDSWRQRINQSKLVVIEIGAGKAIPNIRMLSHSMDAPIIRINPDRALLSVPKGVSIAQSALMALEGISRAFEKISTE